MRHLGFFVMVLLLAVSPAGARKKVKNPELEVVKARAERVLGEIHLDGRVKNTSDKPIEGLLLAFNFFAVGNAPVTTQKITIDEPVLAPGEESTFRVAMNDHVRAVEVVIKAYDRAWKELRVDKAGPFPIE